MATEDSLQRRTQPGTGVAIQYPDDEPDVVNGWRRYSGPAADEPLQDPEIAEWLLTFFEVSPF